MSAIFYTERGFCKSVKDKSGNKYAHDWGTFAEDVIW